MGVHFSAKADGIRRLNHFERLRGNSSDQWFQFKGLERVEDLKNFSDQDFSCEHLRSSN